jgi:hypothetical protein
MANFSQFPELQKHLRVLGKIGYNKNKPIYKHGELSPKDYTSECVDALEYNEMTFEMTVHFEKRGSYLYKDVEPQVYSEFNNAGSRGQYFNLYVRGNYESQRIG